MGHKTRVLAQNDQLMRKLVENIKTIKKKKKEQRTRNKKEQEKKWNRRLVSLIGKASVCCAGGSGSIPGRTTTQGFKIIEKVLLLH